MILGAQIPHLDFFKMKQIFRLKKDTKMQDKIEQKTPQRKPN